MTISSILILLAAVCFLGAVTELQKRANLVAVGLFLYMLALLIRV